MQITEFMDKVSPLFEETVTDETKVNADLRDPGHRDLLALAVALVDEVGSFERNFALAGLFQGYYRQALGFRYPAEILDDKAIADHVKDMDPLTRVFMRLPFDDAEAVVEMKQQMARKLAELNQQIDEALTIGANTTRS